MTNVVGRIALGALIAMAVVLAMLLALVGDVLERSGMHDIG